MKARMIAGLWVISLAACGERTAGPDPAATIQLAEHQLPPGSVPVRACGTLLTVAGEYWLTKDLSCGTARVPLPALSIQGTGITLHLNGHTVRSTPGAPGEGCLSISGSGNAVLGPGTLGSYCEHAILLEGKDHRIRGIYLKAFDLGILGDGPGHTIEDVTFGGGGYAPLWLGTSDHLVLRSNTVTGHLENGFDLFGDGMTVQNNSFDSSGYGIRLHGNGSVILNNRFRWVGWPAFEAFGTGNTIAGNLFRHNLWDIVDNNVSPCTANTYFDNVFVRASDPCIQ